MSLQFSKCDFDSLPLSAIENNLSTAVFGLPSLIISVIPGQSITVERFNHT